MFRVAALSAVNSPLPLKFAQADQLVTPAVLTASTVSKTTVPVSGNRPRTAIRNATATKTTAKAVRESASRFRATNAGTAQCAINTMGRNAATMIATAEIG